MDFKTFLKSKNFKMAVGIAGGIFLLLAVFNAGIHVGYRKAGFSYKYNDNYFRNFGGKRGDERGIMSPENDRRGMMGRAPFEKFLGDPGFMRSSGATGKVVGINGQTVVIKDIDGLEKIAVIGEKTSIMKFRDAIKLSDLKTDDAVVVIGRPNDSGQIEAQLIRVMPVNNLSSQTNTNNNSSTSVPEVKN